MPLSLRLTIVFTTLGLALISASSGLAWYLSAQEIRQSVDADLLEAAELLETISQRELGNVARNAADGREPPVGNILGSQESGIQFFGSDFTPRGATVVEPSAVTVSRVLDGAPQTLETIVQGDVRYRVLTTVLPFELDVTSAFEGVAIIQLYRDTTREEAAISTLALRLVLPSAFGVVVVAITSWFVGRWLARPLNRLAGVAERLAELDDPPARIEVSRSDEIGRLADSFNRMLSALEVGREQQQRLVADASHELRTPLTSLRMRAEFLATEPDDHDLRASVLAGAVVEIEQLSALVNDLIDLAVDVRSSDEQPQLVELVDIADDVAGRTSIAANRLVSVDADNTRAWVRPSMVRRALQNLVDNAIKYGPVDGDVSITVVGGRMEVTDQGPGIAPEDADYVFDRFYRSPKARTRPGNGIGLAIVKQVAAAHNGTTWIANNSDGGATVGFSVSTHLSSTFVAE